MVIKCYERLFCCSVILYSAFSGVPLVSVKRFKYECDNKCPHYKSIHLCSHTVAAAEIHIKLKAFIKLKRSCDSPNLMRLGTHGMPAGAGCKGGKLAKKKQTTKRRAPSDENRVALNTTAQFQPQLSSKTLLYKCPLEDYKMHHMY